MADSIVNVKILGDAAGLAGAVSSANAALSTLGATAASASRAFSVLGSSAPRFFAPLEGFANTFDKQRSALSLLSAEYGRFAAVLGAGAAVGAVASFGKALFTAGAEAERIGLVLKQATGSSAGAAREFDFVRSVAQTLGIELNGAASAYAGIAAAAKGTILEGQGARDIFQGVATAAANLGLSAADTSGVLLAVQQIMSKGTVSAEELRGQIGERLPGAFGLAAKAMGVTTQELGKMLEAGVLSSTEFLPKFAAALQAMGGGEIKTATSELNRLSNAWETFKQNLAGAGFESAAVGAIGAINSTLSSINTAFSRGGDSAGSAFAETMILAIQRGLPIFGDKAAEFLRAQIDAQKTQAAGGADDGSFDRKEAARAKSQEAFSPSETEKEFISLQEKQAGITKEYVNTLAILNAEYARGGLSVDDYRAKVEKLIFSETEAGKAAVAAVKERLDGYQKLAAAVQSAIQDSAKEEAAARAKAAELRESKSGVAQTTDDILFGIDQKGRTPEEQKTAIEERASNVLLEAQSAGLTASGLAAQGNLAEAEKVLLKAQELASKAQALGAQVDSKGLVTESGAVKEGLIEQQAKIEDQKAAAAAETAAAQAQTLAELNVQIAQMQAQLGAMGIKITGVEEAKQQVAAILATIPAQITTQWNIAQNAASAAPGVLPTNTVVNNLTQPSVDQPAKAAGGDFGTINLMIGDSGPFPVQTNQSTSTDIAAALQKAALQRGRQR